MIVYTDKKYGDEVFCDMPTAICIIHDRVDESDEETLSQILEIVALEIRNICCEEGKITFDGKSWGKETYDLVDVREIIKNRVDFADEEMLAQLLELLCVHVKDARIEEAT